MNVWKSKWIDGRRTMTPSASDSGSKNNSIPPCPIRRFRYPATIMITPLLPLSLVSSLIMLKMGHRKKKVHNEAITERRPTWVRQQDNFSDEYADSKYSFPSQSCCICCIPIIKTRIPSKGSVDNELCDDARLTPHPWICSTLHRCHMALVRLVLQ